MMSNNRDIPKVINYFWFGKAPLPPLVRECIKSWKKFCSDYEIKRWDESNFDINICDYVKEAYMAKKWAFVSDYARFYILNKYGGIYLDTDVELIKSIEPIRKKGSFFALETEEYDSLNPGIGMATYANNGFYKKIINNYNQDHFIDKYGLENKTPVGKRVANFLKKDGLKNIRGIQKVDNIIIYPKDYFCPLNYFTGQSHFTENTVAIHHYSASWLTSDEKKYHKIGQRVSKIFGRKIGEEVEKVIRFPYSFKRKWEKKGFINTVKYYFRKVV
ncbi:glycosyltransferase family 32 protein [Lactobacillus helveticus]|nr:glycosyltransferase [Lactobacillus helveticus]